MEKIVDNVGRVVIPIGMRKKLGLVEGSKINIELKNDSIIITNSKIVNLKNYISEIQLKKDTSDETYKVLEDILNKIEEN